MKFCELYKIINNYTNLAKDLGIDTNNIAIRFKEDNTWYTSFAYISIGKENNLPAIYVNFDLTRAYYFTSGINKDIGKTIKTVADFDEFAKNIKDFCIHFHSMSTSTTDQIIHAEKGQTVVISHKLKSAMHIDTIDLSLHHAYSVNNEYSASILISFSLIGDKSS